MTGARRDSGPSVRPPRAAQLLVSVTAPGRTRDALLGDLAEGFRRILETQGNPEARRWYWRQALASLVAAARYPLRWRLARTRRRLERGGVTGGVGLDLRMAFRAFHRRPGYTALVVGTLALGIGANAAIVSFVHSVLLRPLPFPSPEALVSLWEHDLAEGDRTGVAPPTLADWQVRNDVFTELAGFTKSSVVLAGGRAPERISAGVASPNFFRVLGVPLRYGGGFASDETLGEDRVVVTSAGFARRWFGEGVDPEGRALTLNDRRYTVVGVLPDRFRFLEEPDLWMPLRFTPDEMTEGMRGARYLEVVGRLKPEVSIDRAEESMQALADALADIHPNSVGWGVALSGLHEHLTRDVRRPLLIILAGVVFVLLIACGNTTNLVLVRSLAARRDWAVRTALGASSWQLFRASLVEHLLLAAGAGLVATVLTSWVLPVLVRLAPADLPRLGDVRVDLVVTSFILAVSLVAAVAMSALPWVSGVVRQTVSGGVGGRALTSPPRNGLRHFVIGGEVAVAVVLLIGAGLLGKSFLRLRGVDPGFDPNRLSVVPVSLPGERYPAAADRVRFGEEFVRRLRELPGIEAAALTNNLPFSGSRFRFGFQVDALPVSPGESQPSAEFHAVGPGYFEAMGITLRAGRPFLPSDRAGGPPVVVINEVIARRYWAGADPLGERLTVVSQGGAVSREIVGIVTSVKHGGPSSEWIPEVYVPFAQDAWSFMTFVIRADDGLELPAIVRTLSAAADPVLPTPVVRSMTEVAARWFAPLRFQMLLASAFAAFALSLACVGLYGVIAYLVSARTREIGIRMALGARREDVFRSVVGFGVVVSVIGIAAGLGLAAAGSRALSSVLFDVVPLDAMTYVGVAVAVFLVSLAASMIPARRAMCVEPTVALRFE